MGLRIILMSLAFLTILSVWPGEAVASNGAKVSTRLMLLQANPAPEEVAQFFRDFDSAMQPAKPGFNKTREDAIRSECSTHPPTTEVFALAAILLSLFVEPAIDYLFASISKKLKKEGARYSTSYSAMTAAPFYQQGQPGKALAWSCFRFSRFENSSLALDLVGQFHMNQGKESMQIRPLRLYFAEKGVEKAENNEVGIAAEIEVTSVFLDGLVSKKQTAFTAKLFSSKRTIPFIKPDRQKGQLNKIRKNRNLLKNAPITISLFDYMGFGGGDIPLKWQKYPARPLPRWSIDSKNNASGTGTANITISIAEAGKKSDILEFATWYFDQTKDKWSKLLKDAAKKAIEPEDS